ncbi:MAG: flagellar filament capping protein FliD [Gammaproteobacteria bacterium]
MALSSPGIGSGLDVNGIIENLMAVERQPLVALEGRNVQLKAQVSAYGSLKGAVSSFRDAVAKLADLAKFKVYTATSSDKDVLSGIASATAARGVYSLQVNRIAENHRMASTQVFADADTTVIGTAGDAMTIGTGGSNFVVEIGGKTLNQVRDEINASTSNTGVTASVMKDDLGYRLTLAANGTGSASALTVSYSAADPFTLTTLNADRDSTAGFNVADLDASVKLEGQFDVTSSSNTLTEAIQGVSITLKKAGTVTLNVERDTGAVERSVQEFTKAYSDLVGLMGKMRREVLKPDSPVLLNIESQMRAVLNAQSRAESTFSNAFEIGISTQKSGTLELNTKTLGGALGNDFEGIANLFADPDNGLAVKLRNLADSFLATGGPLDGRTQGLDSELRQNDDRKTRLEERLRQVQLRFTQQFASLDSLVSRLTQTGDLLTKQLASLTGQKNSN